MKKCLSHNFIVWKECLSHNSIVQKNCFCYFHKIFAIKTMAKGLLFNSSRGGFRVEGGRPLRQRFDPLPTQKVPLSTILRYPFLVTDPKNFLMVPLAPINTDFEGGARAEKTQFFWSKFSKNCSKMPFLACLFKFLPAAQNIWPKQGLCSA